LRPFLFFIKGHILSIDLNNTDLHTSDSATAESTSPKAAKPSAFESLNLHPTLLRAVLEAGYDTPTAVQAQAIPEALKGRDIMASAQTGTGKTAAFTLPALNLLATPHASNSRGPRILVLTPTRELAAQVNEAARKYGKYIRARTVSIVGGMPYPLQNKLLSQPLDILVATPGRFIDHMERGRIDLSRLQMLVLDEADRMLDMGFMPDVEKICAALPKDRQTLLFSATLDGIGHIAKQFLNNPLTIQVAAQREKHANIEQRLHYVDDMTHKNKLLEHLLIAPGMNQAIIFTSTKRHADLLAEDLYAAGHKTAALHGDMTQGARNRTLTKLRHGDVKVLVATDVAARGIDVQGISHVINYDLPKFAEDYVHRIGRTGRANNKGIAISFASNMDRHLLRKIEQFTGHKFDAAVIEGFEPKRSFSAANGKPDGARRSNGDRGGYGAGRNERSAHKPGSRDGYQSRDAGRDNRGTFGDRIMGEKPAGRDGEKSYGPRSGGFNDRNKTRVDSARPASRSFGDNAYADRPARNAERFANDANKGFNKPIPRDESGEVNGNSRNYTKDTDMQFARALSKDLVSKGFGDRGQQKPFGRKPDAARAAPRTENKASFGEKFGNPRPRPTGDRANSNKPASRTNAGSYGNGENTPKRPRSFA
jgi:superfamily II DNA/RNA helicase